MNKVNEFIDTDLELIDGTDSEFLNHLTITNVPKKNGDRPATTDDINKQGRQPPSIFYLSRGYSGGFGVGISEEKLINDKNKDKLTDLYDEPILNKNLDELKKSLARIQQQLSVEQYNDIVEIVYREVKEIYELSKKTIQDSH